MTDPSDFKETRRPLSYLPLAGLALRFLRFDFAGIWTCASAVTASSKLSGCRDSGAPRRPAGLRGLLAFVLCGMVCRSRSVGEFKLLGNVGQHPQDASGQERYQKAGEGN